MSSVVCNGRPVKYWAGVGSRETPLEILHLMVRLGRTLTDLGFPLSSGDAVGADRAFYRGASLSPRYAEVGSRIYLHKNGYQCRWRDPKQGFLVASDYPDTYPRAVQMASQARGGFYGLGPGGIALQTRNVFQIHGHTLQDTIGALYYYGVPVGKPENEKVRGGTNTAVRLGVMANVPQRHNLYFEATRQRAVAFLAKYETQDSYPEDILGLWDPQIYPDADKRYPDQHPLLTRLGIAPDHSDIVKSQGAL